MPHKQYLEVARAIREHFEPLGFAVSLANARNNEIVCTDVVGNVTNDGKPDAAPTFVIWVGTK